MTQPALASASTPLPHAERIQAGFGHHDVSHARAAIGGPARAASEAIGAAAFTSGHRVGFREAPDLRLAAHEAAHVVQQEAGVQLAGGVGHADDPYERQADEVADAVASGRSAQHLLDAPIAGSPASVQRQCGCGGTCVSCSQQVQMFPWGHTQHPRQPAYPSTPDLHPGGANCDQRALAAIDSEVVELQGTPIFDPSSLVADALWCAHPLPSFVRAKFGNLARGVIRVRPVPLPTVMAPGSTARPALTYETATDEEFLELDHPSFPGGGFDYPPRLRIWIDRGIVAGAVSFFPGAGRVRAIGVRPWVEGYAVERLLGWRGLRNVTPSGVVNELRDGVLTFTFGSFSFKLDDTSVAGGLRYDGPDALGGTGRFSVVDAAETFSADAEIHGDGITGGTMVLHKAATRIFGSSSFALSLAPVDAFHGTFSGRIEGNFAGGALTLQGTARYRSRRVRGDLTVLFAPRAVAWARVSRRLPPGAANAPFITFGQAMRPGYTLVGWGSVDFAVNEWLTGSVSAVLDPDGYITSHGILRPTKQFQFLTDSERWSRGISLGRLEGSIGALPWPVSAAVDITGNVWAELFAEGRVGPARIYGLEVEGTFSTRPGAVFEARATGRVNLSAWGRLRAELGSGVHFEILMGVLKPGELNIVGTATATVRAYVELQPTFERIADPAQPDTARYKIKGELTAAGAMDLGLSGRIEILVAGRRVWWKNLGRYQWNIGSLGMKASIDHEIGSDAPVQLGFESADFDGARFASTIEDVMHRRGDRNDRRHDDAELRQDPSTAPAAQAATPTSLELDFTMKGAPHRLWLEHRPNAVIRMSSDEDDLADKLRAEIASTRAQQQATSDDSAQELAGAEAQARQLLSRTRATERALDDLQSESRQAGNVAGFDELADGLTTYAEQYDRTDLAQPALPPATSVTVTNGRYVITNRAELDAVRAIAPQENQPPEGLDPELAGMWTQYAGTYFPNRLRAIDRDLTRSGTTDKQGPRTWDAYSAGERRMREVRGAKAFQPELRRLILDERPELEPATVEIDVGLRPTRRGVPHTTGFADVVITDAQNESLEVYSAKVHDVASQAVGRSDPEVLEWIDATMATDVDEAARKYGYEVEFRRERQSTPEGRRGPHRNPRHPLFRERVYVSTVHLVWRYTPSLIPGRFVDPIIEAGQEHGIDQRRRSRVNVDFLLRPEPPLNPP